MEMALGMSPSDTSVSGARGTHGDELRSTTGWSSLNGNNNTGFNVYPAGSNISSLINLSNYGYFWSTTEDGTGNNVYYRRFNNNSNVNRGPSLKTNGLSCRCIRSY
jgi:uncharacterized protein (TIGR02145 family)